MKQQLRITHYTEGTGRSYRWFMMILVTLFVLGFAIPSMAQTDMAHVRIGHFVFDGSPANLYVDGDVINGLDGLPAVFYPITLSEHYLDFEAGSHTFALTADGEAMDSATISDEEFTFEADHDYLLATMGNVLADDVHFLLIDETAELEGMDFNASAITIFIDNLVGIPAIDAYFNGISHFENLAYGDYHVLPDPTEGTGSLITANGDMASVVFEFPEAEPLPANMLAVFLFSGAFPGTIFEDYTPAYFTRFLGEMTILDGGEIAVGDSVEVNFDGIGQRAQYTLTLDTAMSLDITVIADSVESGDDAYLRIYNSSGDIILDNDELSYDDNDAGVWDAGVLGLELDAGTYILEPATFSDLGVGSFTLSVSESE